MKFFTALFASIVCADILPHARKTGALSILGGTGVQRGIEVAETALNAETFSCRYYPKIDEDLAGIGGETFIKAKSAKFSRDVSLKGEVMGSTGPMAFTLVTACTVANDVDAFGDGSGDLLLAEVTEDQNRTGWRAADFKLTSDPLLTV